MALDQFAPGTLYQKNAGVLIWSSPARDAPKPRCAVALTQRESEVLDWIRQGKTSVEIAMILGCAGRTVDKHLANIYRKMGAMADIETLEELEIRFIQDAGTILPGDCLCWNNWTLDLGSLIDFRINVHYMMPFENLLDVFAEVVPHHPVIAANRLGETTGHVLRLSDFESDRQFRENPLFREVYRHIYSRAS